MLEAETVSPPEGTQPSVNICSRAGLPAAIASWRPDLVISTVPVDHITEGGVVFRSAMIEDIYNAQLLSYKKALRDVLAAHASRILIHCEYGQSRSAALAVAKLYQRDPDSIGQFLKEHSEAQPNPLLLLFADEILDADGDLLRRCRGRYKGAQL